MAKIELTETEKREVLECLEKGKPLNDRFRFILFGDKREVELVWNGKTSDVCSVVMPFQVIEQVDEPRGEKKEKDKQGLLFSLDNRGRQLKGWTNKLIWGDNKLILSSLKNGPMREEIEKNGGIKLIYIDPPFDVGADFSMDIEIGDDTFTKDANILEEIAYRDTWGRGQDSFIAMIYERLSLLRDLLANEGSIYVHCDYRLSSHLRFVLDEIFGIDNFLSEIIWQGTTGDTSAKNKKYIKSHDTILFYEKTRGQHVWNDVFQEMSEGGLRPYKYIDEKGRYRWTDSSNPGKKGYIYDLGFGEKLPQNGYRMPKETALKWIEEGILKAEQGIVPCIKRYLNEEGVRCKDVWSDLKSLQSNESIAYPTQKTEAILERIIKASSNEGDIVADFFCGSGTTLAVAEKLGRKWIGSDLGKFGIHTTRKRMITVQRQLKEDGKDYRAFEILNLGKYERQHFIGVNVNLREKQQAKQLEEKEKNFTELILRAYKAERIENFNCFLGKKSGRLVAVGPINLPVTRLFVEEIILECRQKHITKADILAFEYEMGLFPNIQEEAKTKGIDLAMKYIPPDVFDKRAVDKGEVVFHDVAYIEITPRYNGNKVAVELTDFSVFYSQESVKKVAENLKNGGTKIVVEKGKIIKITKSKIGEVSKETLTKSWTDWIDYWAVDFDFENKREIVRIKNPETDEIEEKWTGDYIFENEWQSFRTKKNRSLELKSIEFEYKKGKRYKIAVKVVDIFGNDTMKIIEVGV